MIGGFQVVCNLNTLVIDRVYIFYGESHLSIALLSLVML